MRLPTTSCRLAPSVHDINWTADSPKLVRNVAGPAKSRRNAKCLRPYACRKHLLANLKPSSTSPFSSSLSACAHCSFSASSSYLRRSLRVRWPTGFLGRPRRRVGVGPRVDVLSLFLEVSLSSIVVKLSLSLIVNIDESLSSIASSSSQPISKLDALLPGVVG